MRIYAARPATPTNAKGSSTVECARPGSRLTVLERVAAHGRGTAHRKRSGAPSLVCTGPGLLVMRIVRSLGALAVLAALWLAIGVSSASAAAVVNTIPVGSAPRGRVVGWHPRLGRELRTTVRSVRSTRRAARSSTRSRSAATPTGVSSDGTHVWVANGGDGTVSEIDASTGTVVSTIPVGSDPDRRCPRMAPTSGSRTSRRYGQ